MAITCQITVRAGGAHPPVSLNHFVLEGGHSLYASHQTFVVWQENENTPQAVPQLIPPNILMCLQVLYLPEYT